MKPIFICQLDARKQAIARNYYMLAMLASGESFTNQDVDDFINNKIVDTPYELQALLK